MHLDADEEIGSVRLFTKVLAWGTRPIVFHPEDKAVEVKGRDPMI